MKNFRGPVHPRTPFGRKQRVTQLVHVRHAPEAGRVAQTLPLFGLSGVGAAEAAAVTPERRPRGLWVAHVPSPPTVADLSLVRGSAGPRALPARAGRGRTAPTARTGRDRPNAGRPGRRRRAASSPNRRSGSVPGCCRRGLLVRCRHPARRGHSRQVVGREASPWGGRCQERRVRPGPSSFALKRPGEGCALPPSGTTAERRGVRRGRGHADVLQAGHDGGGSTAGP